MDQNLVVVFDRPRRGLPSDWSLSDLLGRVLQHKCTASTQSTIHFFPGIDKIQLYHGRDGFKEALANRVIQSSDCIYLFGLVANIPDIGHDFHIKGLEKSSSSLGSHEIKVTRNLAGIGQESGTLVLRIANPTKRTILVKYLESIPPFMKPFLSQMTFALNGRIVTTDSLVQHTLFLPSIFRQRSAQLEMKILIPGESTIRMELFFDKEFLRYTDYPFDPNRGFDLAGATIEYDSADGRTDRIVTQKLLVTMPTPDFTMPYNVITLTSTLIVLFYGTFFNLSFRRFYTGPALIVRMRNRLKQLLWRKPAIQ